jgi:hypothetical protein
MNTLPTQRSFPAVLQDISTNLQEIIRSEFKLAKAEVKIAGTKATQPAGILLAGLALGLYGGGFILLTIVHGLSLVLPAWLAALIVGFILTLASVAMVLSGGRKLKNIDPTPDRALRNLEENVQWAKHQIK